MSKWLIMLGVPALSSKYPSEFKNILFVETLIFKIEVPAFYHHLAYGHIRAYSLSIQPIFLRDINVEIDGELPRTFDFFVPVKDVPVTLFPLTSTPDLKAIFARDCLRNNRRRSRFKIVTLASDETTDGGSSRRPACPRPIHARCSLVFPLIQTSFFNTCK